jgi:hypothetical protein
VKKTVIRHIDTLRARERAGHRPRGYVKMCLRLGRHDPATGQIHFTPAVFRHIRRRQLMARGIVRRGAGDWLQWLLHPFVRLSDRWFGTKWETCTRCHLRKTWLNRKFRALTRRFFHVRHSFSGGGKPFATPMKRP